MSETLTDGQATPTPAAQQTAAEAAPAQADAGKDAQGQQAAPAAQPSTDAGAKPTGEQGADVAAATEAKPAGAPEKYEFKAPEGQAFDPDVIGRFSEVAKELNLPQDAAQKILDEVSPKIAAAQQKAAEMVFHEWEQQSKADKEFGGAKLNENLATAQRALDAFGTPELKTLLAKSGFGNHPEVIRLLYRAGQTVTEDKFVRGADSAPAQTAAQRLYGSNA